MIYLTFDSNIWIYSLDESWLIDNQLDYLEPWIENNEVKILLPKIIISEWEKHESKQVEVRKKSLREFFNMADEILPSAFFSEYKEPKNQETIIENQLNRIKHIIYEAEVIPNYPEVKERIIEWGILKKAPMHKKSSIADAMIVYSLIQFAKENPGNHYFFISNNTEDFYDKKNGEKTIHSDLKQEFEFYNIKAFEHLNRLTYFLKDFHGLKIDMQLIRQKRKERIKNKIKNKAYNPDYEKIITDNNTSFIQNLSTIEYILKEKKPTKEQVIYILALLDTDSSYEREFYKKLSSKSWFYILKQKGVFKAENNPSLIRINGTVRTPSWPPLVYLENLSIQIKEGRALDLIDEIINIIQDFSETPIDNDYTWYTFIRIISNIPNDKIPISLLNFVPLWLSDANHSGLVGSEICRNLLPKFLTQSPTNDDIKKAELILDYIFSIKESNTVVPNGLGVANQSYKSVVQIHDLTDFIIDEKLIKSIGTNCSNSLVHKLADNIKKLSFSFPNGINFIIKSKSTEYKVKAEINDADLILTFVNKIGPNNVIESQKISNFENLDKIQTKEALLLILNNLNIKYENNDDNEHNIDLLLNALINGTNYAFLNKSLSEISDEFHFEETTLNAFSIIFRDLLNAKVKYDCKHGLELLEIFSINSKYRHPFFNRAVFYVIGENWKTTKSIFWKMVKGDDSNFIFSNFYYEKDLYELLKKNQKLFDVNEIDRLQKIVSKGPHYPRVLNDKKNIDYWKLRWYSSLRAILPFNSLYKNLSKNLNLTSDSFENNDVSSAYVGDTSPINLDELLQKKNNEIVNLILDFKNKGGWSGPSVDGLAQTLEQGIRKEPQKFADEIYLYKNVKYIYAYHIALGFNEAWKNKLDFNWKNVLDFFEKYINNEKFISGKLTSEYDSWDANANWVIGAIGNLLAAGLQSDDNAFSLDLLPTAKNILTTLINRLEPERDQQLTTIDYPTYSLNSTAGKLLRALLDYSLRRARNLKPENNTSRWEKEIENLMEETFKKEIIDSYILTGWFFQQYFYLDNEWIKNKVKKYYHINRENWLAFFNGFTYGNPPFNKDLYELFFPHYERAIREKITIKSPNRYGISHHIAAFYFWDFEDITTNGLLKMLVTHGTQSSILNFVFHISSQEQSINSLNNEKASQLKRKIFELWKFLSNKFKDSKDNERQEILASLIYFVTFVSELDENITSLVVSSSKLSEKYSHTHYLIENLIRLKNNGEPKDVAKHIGTILNSLTFENLYIARRDKDKLVELVEFLYGNDSRKAADEICDKVTKQGSDFLIEVYKKYKSVET